MAPLPPAVLDDTLAIGGEEIAARRLATRMTVPVEVNGTGPYRFVVDSGADTSVVGRRLAARLALPAGSPVMLNGITESRLVDRVGVDSLTVGPTRVEYLQLPVLDEGDLGGDGMIGLDALVEQRLMLDFEQRTISVDDARRPVRKLDGEIVVTARLRKGQLILASVRAGRTGLNAIVDTGSELTIGNSALRQRLEKNLRDRFETIELTGVTGTTIVLQLVRVPELRIGPVILRDVPVAFADIPPFAVFGLADQPALLLGTDLMETFRKVMAVPMGLLFFLSEGIARFMGTPQFLLWMTVFVALWLGWNTIAPRELQFDSKDLNFTLLTLMDAGYYEEAARWRDWLIRAAAGSPDQVQIMYGIAGERRLVEWELPWLSGFRKSTPVRIGNAAHGQLQLDVYGEVIDGEVIDGDALS